jgi:hypothetical protein
VPAVESAARRRALLDEVEGEAGAVGGGRQRRESRRLGRARRIPEARRLPAPQQRGPGERIDREAVAGAQHELGAILLEGRRIGRLSSHAVCTEGEAQRFDERPHGEMQITPRGIAVAQPAIRIEANGQAIARDSDAPRLRVVRRRRPRRRDERRLDRRTPDPAHPV